MEKLCETCAFDREGRFNKTCRHCQDASLILRTFPNWTPKPKVVTVRNITFRHDEPAAGALMEHLSEHKMLDPLPELTSSILKQQMQKMRREIADEIMDLDIAIAKMRKQLADLREVHPPMLPIGALVNIEAEIVDIDTEQHYYYVAVRSKIDGEEIMREWFSADDVTAIVDDPVIPPFTTPLEE